MRFAIYENETLVIREQEIAELPPGAKKVTQEFLAIVSPPIGAVRQPPAEILAAFNALA